MKGWGRWVVYLTFSLLLLYAFDGLVMNPAGRWQLVVAQGFGVWKMDTTSGQVWKWDGEKWDRVGPK